MRIVNYLEQNTPAWEKWRVRGIGSSDSAVLWHGEHFGMTIYDLWKDKVGQGKQKPESYAMTRGKRLEGQVRETYERLTGFKAEPVCALHAEYDFIKASLDGWNAEHGVIPEIKCPNKHVHQDALDGKVADKYLPQLYHQFIVSSGLCKEVHFVSFNDLSFNSVQKFALVSMPAAFFSGSICAQLIAKEVEFWSYVTRKVPPRDTFRPLAEELP